jgi:hypothetical protein
MMKNLSMTLGLVLFLILFACAPQSDKAAPDSNQPARITASGYTKEGCLVNLKMAAHEQRMRLNPNDVTLDANSFLSFFPILNNEGYRCSAGVREPEKRFKSGDSLYPID